MLNRSVRPALMSLLAVTLVGSTALVGAAPAGATTTRAQRMVEKINTARANHGLRPLHTSPDLMAAARAHSGAMSGQGCCSTRPRSRPCAAGTTSPRTSAWATASWTCTMPSWRSAPHRANILDRRMDQVGVGFVSVNGQLWVTEVFRSRRADPRQPVLVIDRRRVA